MKMFTWRFGQFCGCALFVTLLFRYALGLCIGTNRGMLSVLCSVVYAICMFLCGWYFGKKDGAENGFHGVGFRFHAATYLLCIGVGYVALLAGWNTESPKAMAITAISWGGALVVHLVLFLVERRRTIKGYDKDDLFVF